MRPFVHSAKVSPLGCSRALQRVIVGFAADQPFAQARNKLREHYDVEIGESTIQRITFGHAEAMYDASRKGVDFPQQPGSDQPIIVETDLFAVGQTRSEALLQQTPQFPPASSLKLIVPSIGIRSVYDTY